MLLLLMNKTLILDTVRGWVAKHLTPDVGEFSVEELQRPPFELETLESSDNPSNDLSGAYFALSLPSQASLCCWIATAGRGSSYSMYDEKHDDEICVYRFPEFESVQKLEARLSEVVSAFLRQHVYEPTLDEWAFDKGGSNKTGVRVESASSNRSFARDSKRNLVSEVSKRERKKRGDS